MLSLIPSSSSASGITASIRPAARNASRRSHHHLHLASSLRFIATLASSTTTGASGLALPSLARDGGDGNDSGDEERTGSTSVPDNAPPQTVFESFETLMDYLRSYATTHGFALKRHSWTKNSKGENYRLEVRCSREGHLDKRSVLKQQLEGPSMYQSKKCNCPWRIYVVAVNPAVPDFLNQYRIRHFQNRVHLTHSHTAIPSTAVRRKALQAARPKPTAADVKAAVRERREALAAALQPPASDAVPEDLFCRCKSACVDARCRCRSFGRRCNSKCHKGTYCSSYEDAIIQVPRTIQAPAPTQPQAAGQHANTVPTATSQTATSQAPQHQTPTEDSDRLAALENQLIALTRTMAAQAEAFQLNIRPSQQQRPEPRDRLGALEAKLDALTRALTAQAEAGVQSPQQQQQQQHSHPHPHPQSQSQSRPQTQSQRQLYPEGFAALQQYISPAFRLQQNNQDLDLRGQIGMGGYGQQFPQQ